MQAFLAGLVKRRLTFGGLTNYIEGTNDSLGPFGRELSVTPN